VSEWTKVYDLADDETHIRHMQEATVHPDDEVGLRPEPALVGSPEWWQAVGTAALPVVTVEGTISDVYMSGHGDMPEFALKQDDGETSRWLRSEDRLWRRGRRARIEYVLQWFKKPIPGFSDDTSTKLVLRMWVGPDAAS
jgi:hypothetical protein